MRSRPTILVNTIHGTFEAFEDDLITEQLIEFSAHTRNELAMLLDHINSDDVVLDIGAHIGTFSIPIAKKAHEGKVYAIEAETENYSLLCKNIELNNTVIESHNILVSGYSNYLFERGEVLENNSGANYYMQPSKSPEIVGVNLATWISDLDIQHVDIIKMDIEGMEFEVLSSIIHILERDRPILYIEIVEEQLQRHGHNALKIQSLLDDIGYKYFTNTGDRNSANDMYIKTEIDDLSSKAFFDVLAIPNKR